jgi:hypothetical protein
MYAAAAAAAALVGPCRCCVLRNFAIDMVGFCEALAVSSAGCIKPILWQLHITCSGNDCVSIGGAAQPLLQHCTMQVRPQTL